MKLEDGVINVDNNVIINAKLRQVVKKTLVTVMNVQTKIIKYQEIVKCVYQIVGDTVARMTVENNAWIKNVLNLMGNV